MRHLLILILRDRGETVFKLMFDAGCFNKVFSAVFMLLQFNVISKWHQIYVGPGILPNTFFVIEGTLTLLSFFPKVCHTMLVLPILMGCSCGLNKIM